MRLGEQEAQSLAEDLSARLGPGWEPRVWANIGWHYASKYQLPGGIRAEVHPGHSRPFERTTYVAYLHRVFIARGDTPLAAFRGAMDVARKHLDEVRSVQHALDMIKVRDEVAEENERIMNEVLERGAVQRIIIDQAGYAAAHDIIKNLERAGFEIKRREDA